jgi:hypothetical protein
LAGHEHQAFVGGAEKLRIGNHNAVIVQAGTATSTRKRGEQNSFNVLRIGPKEMRVHRMTWEPHTLRFGESHSERFERK